MSDNTDPQTTDDAQATPTPESVESRKPSRDRSSLIARLQAKVDGNPEPETQAATLDSATTAEPVPAPAPAEPVKSRAEILREKLQAKAAERQARAEAERGSSEAQQLRAELERYRGQPGIDTWLEKLRTNPAAAIRDAKADPAEILKLLTKEALNPGALQAENEAQRAAREAAEAKRTAEEGQEEFRRYLAEQQVQAERKAFADITGDATRWPTLSKLPPQARMLRGIRKWQEFQASGIEYDREMIADAIEADYEEESKWLNPPAPVAPDPKKSQAASQPKPKASPKTVTAEMASAASSAKPRTRAERKHDLIERLEARRNARADG